MQVAAQVLRMPFSSFGRHAFSFQMPAFFSRQGNSQNVNACAASPAGRLIEFLTAQRNNQLVRRWHRIATPSLIYQPTAG